MATSEHLLGEVMLHEPVMQQGYLDTEFDQSYQPIATIQPGAPIEFLVKSSTQLFLDLNNSRIAVTLRIKKSDGTNLPADTKTAPVNLLLHSLFSEMTMEFNNKVVTDPSSLYPYRAYMETLLNYGSDMQKYKLLTEGWVMDTEKKFDEVAGDDNKGFVERKKMAADSVEVELIGRPHLDLFQQEKLIPPGVDVTLKLLPNSDKFCLMSGDAQANHKIEIKTARLIVHKKQLKPAAALALRQTVQEQSFQIPYVRVLMKHHVIPANSQKVALDNIFSGQLPDLCVVGLVADDAHAGSYTKNPFHFQHFKLKGIELLRNGTKVPRYGYSPDFTGRGFYKDYLTFQEQLGYDTGDRCVNLTPDQWANGSTLYAFKLTDGPIGSGVVGPRSPGNTGSACLQLEFAEAPAANLKLMIMFEQLATLQIDQFNNIIVS